MSVPRLESSAGAVEIRVRARAALVLEAETRGASVELRGYATDGLGEPIPRADLTLAIGADASVHVLADQTGAFTHTLSKARVARLAGPEGRIGVQARFAGDSRYAGAEAFTEVDLVRAGVRLRLIPIRARVTRGTKQAEMVIEATDTSGAPIAELLVDVRLEDAVGSTVTSPVEALRTDPDGLLRLKLDLPEDLGPGTYALVAQTASDAAFQASLARADFTLAVHTELTFAMQPAAAGDEPGVAILGALVDDEGAGVGQQSITLMVDDRAVATLITRADGTFASLLRADRLGLPRARRTARARVAYEPLEPWMTPALSAEVTFRVPQRPPVPWTPYAATAGAILALLGVGWAVRHWRPLARSGAQGANPDINPLEPTASVRLVPHSSAGLRVDVRDALVDRPICGATVELRSLNDADALGAWRTNTAGMAAAAPLPDAFRAGGEWEVVLLAPGYVPLRHAVQGGESLGLSVQMVPWRQFVRDEFRQAVAPLWAPEPFPWGRVSPSQAQIRLFELRGRDFAAVRTWIRHVERAYFGPKLPTEADVAATKELGRVALAPPANSEPSGDGG